MILKQTTYLDTIENVNTPSLNNYGIFKYMLLAPDTFYFETLSDIQTKTDWQTAIFAQSVYPFPEVDVIESKNDEALIFDCKNKTKLKTKEFINRYALSFLVTKEVATKLKSFDGSKLSVYFVDCFNNVYASLVSNKYYGLPTKDISIGVLEVGNDISKVTTMLTLEITTNLSVIPIDFDLSDIQYQRPIILTNETSEITPEAMIVNGQILSTGGKAITEKGFYYSTNKDKVLNGSATKVINTDETTSFNDLLFDLISNTNYYVKAFATNIIGTSFGEIVTVKTLDADPNYSISFELISLTPNEDSFSAEAEITKGAFVSISEFGFVYDTTEGVTIETGTKIEGTGTFASYTATSGTLARGLIYVRPYAITNVGNKYGDEVSQFIGSDSIEYGILRINTFADGKMIIRGYDAMLEDMDNLAISVDDSIEGVLSLVDYTLIDTEAPSPENGYVEYYMYELDFGTKLNEGTLSIAADGFFTLEQEYTDNNIGAIGIHRPIQGGVLTFYAADLIRNKIINGTEFLSVGLIVVQGAETKYFLPVYSVTTPSAGSPAIFFLDYDASMVFTSGIASIEILYNDGIATKKIYKTVVYDNTLLYLTGTQYTLTDNGVNTTVTVKFKAYNQIYYYTDVLTNNTTIKAFDRDGNELTISSQSGAGSAFNYTYTFVISGVHDGIVLDLTGYYNLNQLIN